MARILYLFRTARGESPGAPNEFAYGAPQLAARGHQVDRVDAAGITALAGAPGPGWRLASAVAPFLLPGVPAGTMGHFAAPAVAARLAGYDAVVATTTGLSLAASFAKHRGEFAGRLVCLAMGILADARPPLERALCRWLLRAGTLATLSGAEASFLRARLGAGADIAEVGFGIDAEFWSPGTTPRGRGFALSVGNDRQRDWATLVAAWRPEFPTLKLITRLPVPALPANVELVGGSRDAPAMDDAGLRALYRDAACVIVPVRDTIQPSGQSVTLQAMACGAPVVLTRIAGLWNPDRLRDSDNVRLVPPGDPVALSAVLVQMFSDPDGAAAMGARASALVRREITIDAMATRLEALIVGGTAT